MHAPIGEAELWTSFSRQPYTFNLLDLPATSIFPLHNDRKLSFLTLDRVRTQTPVFWLPIPFAKGTCHLPAHTGVALGPASHTCPQESSSSFCLLGWTKVNEAQTKETHRVQEAALECTFSSPKMDPSPLLQHSISPSLYSSLVSKEPLLPTYVPSSPPKGSSTAPPSQGWDQTSEEEKVKSQRNIRTKPRVMFWCHPQISYLCFVLPYPKSTRGGLGAQSFSPPRLDLASLAS